jgi:hypothetical protein
LRQEDRSRRIDRQETCWLAGEERHTLDGKKTKYRHTGGICTDGRKSGNSRTGDRLTGDRLTGDRLTGDRLTGDIQ